MKPRYIKSSQDLTTSPSAIKQGFLSQALAKSEKSEPYLKRAREFRKALLKITTVDQLIKLKDFRKEVLGAAGFSDKAVGHLSEKDREDALEIFFKKIFGNGIKSAREELVERYLLTKGDTLGGSMRNFVGASAANKLTSSVIKALRAKRIVPKTTQSNSGKITSLSWNNRYLAFDYKTKLVGKNIDVVLLDASNKLLSETFADKKNYLAFGELKGGIDPAGADEHWKTASGALTRIRKVFDSSSLFFVGAAIEIDMAKEIFFSLENGELAFAANLGSKKQLEDLAKWLVNL